MKKWAKRRRRIAATAAMTVACLALFLACQTPPKKTTRSSDARSASLQQGAATNALDLFATSADLFGSDPRTSRPALVSDTVFSLVIGVIAILALVVLVSALRSGRGGRSRRRA